MNWTPILNRTIKVIDEDGPARLSGGQFIRMMQEVIPYLSNYNQFIAVANILIQIAISVYRTLGRLSLSICFDPADPRWYPRAGGSHR